MERRQKVLCRIFTHDGAAALRASIPRREELRCGVHLMIYVPRACTAPQAYLAIARRGNRNSGNRVQGLEDDHVRSARSRHMLDKLRIPSVHGRANHFMYPN